MEPSSLFEKIIEFAKSCIKHYAPYFVGGSVGGMLSGISLFFVGVPGEIVTLGAFILKVIGTLVLGVASGSGAVLAKKWFGSKDDFEKKTTFLKNV